jgi:hypothetical protein
MTEIVLQEWSNSNMAGDEWRWEVNAVSKGEHWSIRARQVDEITGKVYRVAGTYRLKSARGIKAGIERVFENDRIYSEDVDIDWEDIVAAFAKVDSAMAAALKVELERAAQREEELLNPKETAESRYRDSIDQWIDRTNWPPSNATGAGGIGRAVQNHRRKRAIFQYVDAYFKEHGCFPTGEHDIDVVLEDLSQSVPSSDGIGRAIKASGRIALSVVFPTDA